MLHHYFIAGTSPSIPLYVLHTTPLDSTYLVNSIKPVRDSIKIDPDIYFIDLPSHGKSEDVENSNLQFKKIAEEIEKFRESQNHPQIVLLGHGIGGFVAQHYATKYSKNVNKLILSNSASHHRYRNEMAWNIRDQFSNIVKQAIEPHYGKTDHDSIVKRFKYSLSVQFTNPNEELAQQILDQCEKVATKSYIIISNYEIPKFDIREALQRLKIPVLLITGANDVWPKSIVDLYKNDVRNFKHIEVPTSHFPMVEQPDEFWKIILNWL